MQIKMISKDDCPFCLMAREWFVSHNVIFEEQKMNDPADRQALYEKYNVHTVPQIFFGEERIGGYTDLKRRENELLSRLNMNFDADF